MTGRFLRTDSAYFSLSHKPWPVLRYHKTSRCFGAGTPDMGVEMVFVPFIRQVDLCELTCHSSRRARVGVRAREVGQLPVNPACSHVLASHPVRSVLRRQQRSVWPPLQSAPARRPSISAVAPATTRRWTSFMWGMTTSKNRARPSAVTSTPPRYYARSNLAWTLTAALGR